MRRLVCLVVAAAACAVDPATPPPSGSITLQDAFPGLRFQQPLGIVQAPGDSRFFIVEKRGTVEAVANGNVVQLLDISARVNSSPEEAGLLGFAFHPRWQQNRQVFVNYTA